MVTTAHKTGEFKDNIVAYIGAFDYPLPRANHSAQLLGFKTICNFIPVLPPVKCPKCQGKIEVETSEKRWHCMNCGAQKYYGVPELPAQLIHQFWPLITAHLRQQYQPTRHGAIITLGHGTAHFEDTGCKDAPRCLECPFPSCKNPGV